MWYYKLIKAHKNIYGYWLDPNGLAHIVPERGHEGALAKWNFQGYSHAFENGFVRIVNPNWDYDNLAAFLGIEASYITPKQLSYLEKLINENTSYARSIGADLRIEISDRISNKYEMAKPGVALQILKNMVDSESSKKP